MCVNETLGTASDTRATHVVTLGAPSPRENLIVCCHYRSPHSPVKLLCSAISSVWCGLFTPTACLKSHARDFIEGEKKRF